MDVRHFYDLIHQRCLALPTNKHGRAMHDGQEYATTQLGRLGIVGGVTTKNRVPIRKKQLNRRLNANE